MQVKSIYPSLDPVGPTKSNPWITFAVRVEKSIRAFENTLKPKTRVKTTDVKKFASTLKAQKGYDSWEDNEIITAYVAWSNPIKPMVSTQIVGSSLKKPGSKREGLRVRIIPPLPASPLSRSLSPAREEIPPPPYPVHPLHLRRKNIPKHIKTLVWNKYIGGDKAEAKCLSCRQERIDNRNFHCGHVIAEANGGDMTINNLRPICAPCNLSMATRSMNEFTSEFFGWIA